MIILHGRLPRNADHKPVDGFHLVLSGGMSLLDLAREIVSPWFLSSVCPVRDALIRQFPPRGHSHACFRVLSLFIRTRALNEGLKSGLSAEKDRQPSIRDREEQQGLPIDAMIGEGKVVVASYRFGCGST